MTNPIRVIINGASGKMGQETLHALSHQKNILLVAKLTRKDDLKKTLQETLPDVVIDFTAPEVVYSNACQIIQANAHPIIGTTGLTLDQIKDLSQQCDKKKLGALIAPNFSIGIALLMKFAKEAATYFPHCEIIELHHQNKKDAPSGTALKTAEFIDLKAPIEEKGREHLSGARGALHKNVRIHSVRLPSLLAHEEVLLSGDHELLSIRHDTFHRAAFMPGVLLAIEKVPQLTHLVYGLETLL